MTTWDWVYCASLGICNLVILRVFLVLGLRGPLVQRIGIRPAWVAAFSGLAVTLVGGIAHRVMGFGPDITNPRTWVIAFGIPLWLALLSGPILGARGMGRGWHALEDGKSLWRRLPLQLPMGSVDPGAADYQTHPQVSEAEALIRTAIDHARQSNTDRLLALANEAVAWQELGLLRRAVNDFNGARCHFDRSMAILNRATDAESTDRKILSAKRDTLFRLGELSHVQGKREAARPCYEGSLEIDAMLGHDDPAGESVTRDLLERL